MDISDDLVERDINSRTTYNKTKSLQQYDFFSTAAKIDRLASSPYRIPFKLDPRNLATFFW